MSASPDEIRKIVHSELDIRLAGFIKQSWYTLIGLAIASGSAWFSLFYQVQALESTQTQQVILNKEAIIQNQTEIDTLRTDYKSDLREIKEDLKYIRNQI